MDLHLTGKKAFISGSTMGIGLAIATSLAEEGAHVVINGRSDDSVSFALERIRHAVPEAVIEGFSCDLAAAGEAEKLFSQVQALDILVNNLGIYEPKPFGEISDEDWRRFFEINVLSGIRLARTYLPGMKERNWGRIVFISSESGIQIPVEMIHYGVTQNRHAGGLARDCRNLCRYAGNGQCGPARANPHGRCGRIRCKTERRQYPLQILKRNFSGRCAPPRFSNVSPPRRR